MDGVIVLSKQIDCGELRAIRENSEDSNIEN